MADNIPSISEISGSPDAEIGTGHPANVINNQIVAEGLMKSAQFKAESDWNKYTQALSQFKDVFKDAQDIAGLETMPQDTPALKERLGQALDKIGKNPKGFFSGDIVNVEKDLVGIHKDAALSSQHYAYDKFNREYLTKNPALDTPENNAKIEAFGNEKNINDRKLYLLKTPPVFDFKTFKDGVLKQATTGTSSDDVVDANGNVNPNGGYIKTTTGSVTSKDQYSKLWDAGWDTETDQYGRPLKDIITNQYNDLKEKNPKIAEQFPTAKDYYHWLGTSSFGSDKDIQSAKTVKLTPDKTILDAQALQEKTRHDKATEWLGQSKFNLSKDQITKDQQVGHQIYNDLLNNTNTTISGTVPGTKEGINGTVNVDDLPESRQFIGGVVYNDNGVAQSGRVFPKLIIKNQDGSIYDKSADKAKQYNLDEYNIAKSVATSGAKGTVSFPSYPKWVKQEATDDGLSVESRYDVSYRNSNGTKVNTLNDLTATIPNVQKLYSEYKSRAPKGYDNYNAFLKQMAKTYPDLIQAQYEGSNGVGNPNSIIESEEFEQSKSGKKGFSALFGDNADDGTETTTDASGQSGSTTQ